MINMKDTDTDLDTDPAALELVHRYRRMSKAELLEDILRHEKEHRGIDWRALFARGAPVVLRNVIPPVLRLISSASVP